MAIISGKLQRWFPAWLPFHSLRQDNAEQYAGRYTSTITRRSVMLSISLAMDIQDHSMGGNMFSFSLGNDATRLSQPPTSFKPKINNTSEPSNKTIACIASVYITACKPPKIVYTPVTTTRMMAPVQKSTPKNWLNTSAPAKMVTEALVIT